MKIKEYKSAKEHGDLKNIEKDMIKLYHLDETRDPKARYLLQKLELG